jgi:hypothetical protein
MKKFIAIGGIAAMSTLGFIGLGSATAFAAPPTGSAEATVCTAATGLVASQTAANNIDNVLLSNAQSANSAAQALIGPDVSNYVATAATVIDDTDNTPPVTAATMATDSAAFTAASTKVVNDYVAASATSLAVFNAQKVVNSDAFKTGVYGQLESTECAS